MTLLALLAVAAPALAGEQVLTYDLVLSGQTVGTRTLTQSRDGVDGGHALGQEGVGDQILLEHLRFARRPELKAPHVERVPRALFRRKMATRALHRAGKEGFWTASPTGATPRYRVVNHTKAPTRVPSPPPPNGLPVTAATHVPPPRPLPPSLFLLAH